MFDPQVHRVCVITDRRLSGGRPHREIAREALSGGANFIQFRDKDMTSRELYDTALALRELTVERGALFLVNDRADIAAAVGADGVHLGLGDLPVPEARKLLGPRAVIGASAREPSHARRAWREGADYLGVGPVYEARSSKPDAPGPRDVALIRTIRESCDLPVLAIGGIDAGNAAEPLRAGASGVAVISAVVAAPDIAGATAALLAAVERAFAEEGGP